MFGGGFFGKPIPMKGQAQQGAAVPMAGKPAVQQGRALGVVPQGQTVQVNTPAAAVPAQQPQGFQLPPTRVPMGKKGDCPICRG